MTLFIEDNKKLGIVTLSTTTTGGRVVPRATLTRDEALGAAARLLECAMRLPDEQYEEVPGAYLSERMGQPTLTADPAEVWRERPGNEPLYRKVQR